MPLTDTAIRNAKPQLKPFKLFDGGGLFLLVNPNGSRWWRLKFRIGGKEKLLSLGVYPDVSLKEARDKRDEARKLIAQGIDPSAQRKATRAAEAETFEAIAREWLAKFGPSWTPEHAERITRRFERNVFPWIGARPVREVTAPELLAVLRRIEERGALDTAHRAHQNCGQVFRYAVATGRAERDPSADLRGALPPVNDKHHASITDPKAIGALLRAMEGYQGSFVVLCALRLAPLVFVRPGEMRGAEWAEIDFEKAEWRIPASKMKMREQHIVPLSVQALAILRELHPLTGAGRYLFPSERTGERPMSENTVNAALRRLGYSKDEMTGHGFRSMASTLLNEQGWHRDAIERQLAHAERNAVRAAYNYAEHLPERRRMMQAWADYLDGLKNGAEIIPIRKPL
jgi:integrase